MESNTWLDKLSSLTILPEIYKDLAQPGVRKVGIALGDAVDFAIIVTRLMKHGTDITDLYLKRNYDNLQKKLADIPEEKLTKVAPELSVPILQKLTYTSSENLANLFINLLNKAANSDTASEAHPAYISIIESLSVDEAKILQSLRGTDHLKYIDLRLSEAATGTFYTLVRYRTWIEHANHILDFPLNGSVYVSHFISLGILQDMAPGLKVDPDSYDQLKVQNSQFFEATKEAYSQTNPDHKVSWEGSFFEITDFGKAFMATCVPPGAKLTVEEVGI